MSGSFFPVEGMVLIGTLFGPLGLRAYVKKARESDRGLSGSLRFGVSNYEASWEL